MTEKPCPDELVEALRAQAAISSDGFTVTAHICRQLLRKAADEITRLRSKASGDEVAVAHLTNIRTIALKYRGADDDPSWVTEELNAAADFFAALPARACDERLYKVLEKLVMRLDAFENCDKELEDAHELLLAGLPPPPGEGARGDLREGMTQTPADVGGLIEELRCAVDQAAAAINRLNRDYLGGLVRDAWVKWASEQPNPKPSWLAPYDRLSEPDKEADRQIGVHLARIGATTFVTQHRFLIQRILEALSPSIRED